MKLLSTIAAVILSHSIFAQVFWSETFGSGCNQGQLATAFSSANGSWTVTNTVQMPVRQMFGMLALLKTTQELETAAPSVAPMPPCI